MVQNDADIVTVHSLSAEEYRTPSLEIDFLFLDREVCTRCRGTDDALADALDVVSPVLERVNVNVSVNEVQVETAEAARKTGLETSPTIRVNGRDVQPGYRTTECESSGDRCLTGDGDGEEYVECREWYHRGRWHTTPPVALLVKAFLAGAVTPTGKSPQAGTVAPKPRFTPALENTGSYEQYPVSNAGFHASAGLTGVATPGPLPETLSQFFDGKGAQQEKNRSSGESDSCY